MNKIKSTVAILAILAIIAITTALVIAQTGNIADSTNIPIKSNGPVPVDKTAILHNLTSNTSTISEQSSISTSKCTSSPCIYLSVTIQPRWFTYCDGDCDPDGYNYFYMTLTANVVGALDLKAKKGIPVSYNLWVQDTDGTWHFITSETKKTDRKGNVIFVSNYQVPFELRGKGQSAITISSYDPGPSEQWIVPNIFYFEPVPTS